MAKLIVIRDCDDYIPLIVSPPDNLGHENARGQILAAINKAKEDDPDEWNYNAVAAILTAQGFIIHEFEEMDE